MEEIQIPFSALCASALRPHPTAAEDAVGELLEVTEALWQAPADITGVG